MQQALLDVISGLLHLGSLPLQGLQLGNGRLTHFGHFGSLCLHRTISQSVSVSSGCRGLNPYDNLQAFQLIVGQVPTRCAWVLVLAPILPVGTKLHHQGVRADRPSAIDEFAKAGTFFLLPDTEAGKNQHITTGA